MARPSNTTRRWKQLKEKVTAVASEWFSGNSQGKLSMEAEKLTRYSDGKWRLIAEKPTRAISDFNFIFDILSSSPVIEGAISKIAHDAAVDENGDDRGWAAMVKVEPLDDTDESKAHAVAIRKEAQTVINKFVSRTGIGYKTQSYIKKFLIAGDCFAELDFELDPSTSLGQINGIRELPTWQMYKSLDDFGNTISFYQVTSVSKDPITWAIPAQIVHFRSNICDYLPYGQSELMPLRNEWEKFKLIDMDVTMAVHTRAVAAEVHYLGRESGYGFQDISPEELKEYKKKLNDDPTDINRFYVVKQGQTKIEKLDGDATAVKILADVRAQRESTMVWSLGIPLSIAGAQADTNNRHQAAVQQADYARRINAVRKDFSAPLEKVIGIELALNGYNLRDPESLGVARITIQFRWPDLSETRTQRSTRVTKEFTVGARSLESLLYEIGDQDPEGEIARILDERSKGIFPLGTSGFSTPNDQQGKGVRSETDNRNSGTKEDDDDANADDEDA
mgnify:FL=1